MKMLVEFDLVDLTSDEKEEISAMTDTDIDTIGTADEVSTGKLAEMLGSMIEGAQHDYLWPGSNMFAKIENVSCSVAPDEPDTPVALTPAGAVTVLGLIERINAFQGMIEDQVELNMANYDADQVQQLSDEATAIHAIAVELLPDLVKVLDDLKVKLEDKPDEEAAKAG